MKTTRILFIGIVVALALTLVPILSAMALDTTPAPIDPQSWQLHRDRSWNDFLPNPVIDWQKDVNPAGYYNPRNSSNRASQIRGALVLFEYFDRPFITSQPVGSDVLGYYLFKDDGSGYDYERGIVHNPVLSQPRTLTEDQYSTNPADPNFQKDPVFANWWRDYLLGDHPGNHGSNQAEFYMETSYGKWHLKFDAFGPFEINAFEFEIRDSYQGTTELPPSFRNGASYNATTNPNGLRSTGTIDTWAFAIMQTKLNSAPNASYFNNNYDFFHILHAGYDESGVWQEFGMGQYANRTQLPDELTPIGRMHKVEEVLTARPELLQIYVARYANSQCFKDAKALYDETLVAGYSGEPWGTGNHVFKLAQADWDWAYAWKNQTTRNTRYVSWTSWEAGTGEWSHMSSTSTFGSSKNYSTQGECDGMATFAHEFGHIGGLGDNYGNPYTARVTAATEPWELMSRGSFAGPYGDHARWTTPGVEGGSVPVHFMTYNKIQNSYYEANDIITVTNQQLAAQTPLVAEIVARNIPLNNNKTTANPDGLYPWLEEDYGLVSPNYYKAIRLNFGSGTWADQAAASGNVQANGYSWNPSSATRMGIEVVQRTGYDSFAPDDGVLISRNNRVIDAHNYDIALLDYTVPDGLDIASASPIDDYVSYTVGHAAQLWDAAFHAGKSVTDTGYYRTSYETGKYYQQTANNTSIYNVVAAPSTANFATYDPRYYASESSGMSWQKALIKPGSIQQWEPRDGRDIASGDTINEFHDTYNKLHFYILAKNTHEGQYGEFISYQVGVLHDDGLAVSGALAITAKVVEAESWNRVAVVEYTITNTGAAATDILRVTPFGDLDSTVLNDLYAIAPGETVTVPVYVSLGKDFTAADLAGKNVGLEVASESNAANSASAVLTAQEVYQRLLIDVTPVASVKKLNGNKNDLTITVTETYEDGTKEVFTKTFSINNNAADTYVVGPYKVYVDTKGNDQIRACNIVK